MRRFALILLFAVFAFCGANPAFSCTTFVLRADGRVYVGHNLDWHWDNGLVIVNHRHVQKIACVAPAHAPAVWTSKYGSVTFNQFGQEMPFGGMNEAGLVVECMMLAASHYPAADARPEINMLQWIQYQLDNCRTVEEVIATDKLLRIEQPTTPARIHYLVCDAKGDCATIEFLDGKMVSFRGDQLPCRALANTTYEQSVAYARAHPAPAGGMVRQRDQSSLGRFCCAAARADNFKPGTPAEELRYAFETLEQVSRPRTVWRVVYDVSARRIHYRTRPESAERTIELKSLNFSCAGPVQFADIQANPAAAGSLEFRDLTEKRHREYLEQFFAQPSLKLRVGNLVPSIDPLLHALRTYHCADAPSGAAGTK